MPLRRARKRILSGRSSARGITGFCDSHENNGDLLLQGGADFRAHWIIYVIEASAALLVLDRVPLLADHDNHRAALPDLLGDVLHEVNSDGTLSMSMNTRSRP
jgi:hypothetical protein